MGHQVNLQETRWRSVPVVVGPDRNPLSHGPPAPRSAPAPCRGTNWFQQPIQRGCAGGQQPAPHLRVELQMAMALHGRHQMGHRRLETLSADPVGSFPNHDHHLSYRLIVDALTSHRTQRAFSMVRPPQQLDGVLAAMGRLPPRIHRGCGSYRFSRTPGSGPVLLPITPVSPSCSCLLPPDASRLFGSILCAATTSISNLFIEAMRLEAAA